MWWQYKHCPIGPVQSPVYPSCQHCGLVGSGWITGWLEAGSQWPGWEQGWSSSRSRWPPPGLSSSGCPSEHWAVTMSHSLPPPIISKRNITNSLQFGQLFSMFFSSKRGQRVLLRIRQWRYVRHRDIEQRHSQWQWQSQLSVCSNIFLGAESPPWLASSLH